MPASLPPSRTDTAWCKTIAEEVLHKANLQNPEVRHQLWTSESCGMLHCLSIFRVVTSGGHTTDKGIRIHPIQTGTDLLFAEVTKSNFLMCSNLRYSPLVNNENEITHHHVSILSQLPTWPFFSTKNGEISHAYNGQMCLTWPGRVFETELIFLIVWKLNKVYMGTQNTTELEHFYRLTLIFVKYW